MYIIYGTVDQRNKRKISCSDNVTKRVEEWVGQPRDILAAAPSPLSLSSTKKQCHCCGGRRDNPAARGKSANLIGRQNPQYRYISLYLTYRCTKADWFFGAHESIVRIGHSVKTTIRLVFFDRKLSGARELWCLPWSCWSWSWESGSWPSWGWSSSRGCLPPSWSRTGRSSPRAHLQQVGQLI